MNPDDHTLADELHACVMDLARVHHIMSQLLDLLDAFGSPHVELEPSNVIIGSDDRVELRHGSRAARVPWAAPETLKDGTLTSRSNVYSVGAILNAMLANRPGLPDVARDLVEACMNPTPTARPESFESVRAQLRRLGWYALGFACGAWHRRFTEKDDRERTFIASLRKTPDDDAMRGVYADWLEENGDASRAAFLRRLDGEGGLASRDDTSWRAIVSRASIVGCRHTECPARWHALRLIDGIDNRRTCGRCEQTVVYCTSLEDAENHGRTHAPITIDAMLPQADAVTAFGRGRMPMPIPTYNPPAPQPPVGGTLPLPANPPRLDYRRDDNVPPERNALARFFGWFRRNR